MLKNYLLSTLRNITKRKGFSILNVLGLSIGLAASLLILQYVKDELSFDNFHANGENIYRVKYDYYKDGQRVFECATAFNNIGPTLKADYPEVENICRLYLRYGGGIVQYNDISMKETNVFIADQSFLEMFSYPLVAGERHHGIERAQHRRSGRSNGKKIFR